MSSSDEWECDSNVDYSDESDDSTVLDSEIDEVSDGNSSDSEEEASTSTTTVNPWLRTYVGEEPRPPPFTFDETNGPKNIPPDCKEPLDYFLLFFTTQLLNTMVVQTNNYGNKFYNDNKDTLKETSPVRKWKVTCAAEMKGFIAIILNMGLVRKPTIYSYWSRTVSQSTPWFPSVMVRDRFHLLLKFFHLVRTPLPTPGDPNYDPCARFAPIIDVANRQFKYHYTPNKQLSVDESLIGTKNKTQLIQYLPNKGHHKWGIKLWVMCESTTAYVMSFFVYKGKRDTTDAGKGLAHRVVVKLLEMGSCLRKGYHVFCDNFFTSIDLARELLTKRTYITGTIRRNRVGLPAGVKKQLKPGESVYFRQQSLLTTAFREKQSQKNPVILLSSAAHATESEITTRQRGAGDNLRRMKPDVVLDYNQYMGGVDCSDMMLYTYLDERRTLKYWKKVCFTVISRMVVNAYIVYKQHTRSTNKLNHYQFVVKVVEKLAEEQIAIRAAAAAAHAGRRRIVKLPGNKERECVVCSDPKGAGRKRSRTVCSQCDRGLHGECQHLHKCKKAKQQ